MVLDAGHGGKDPGAVGSKRQNREKDINLSIVLEVGRLLSAHNKDIEIIYTRETDKFIELGQRARIANKAKANLFISVHTNAVPKNARKANTCLTKLHFGVIMTMLLRCRKERKL